MAEKNTQWSCFAWRFVLLTLFAIAVIGGITVAIIFLIIQNPVNLGDVSDVAAWDSNNYSIRRKPANYRPLSFEDLIVGKATVHNVYSTHWLGDDSMIVSPDSRSLTSDHGLNIVSVDNLNESKFILDAEFINGFTGELATVSPSGKLIALRKTIAHVFRHSENSIYQIAEINDGKLSNFHAVGPNATGNEVISAFKWNPNSKSHDFIFVCNYNIYYQESVTSKAIAVTENGRNFFRYGIADWLYEEEITDKAMFWSSSGDMFAYIRFDDQYVHRVYVPKFHVNRQYPEYMEVPYPKAGVANQPEVTLFLWNIKQNKKVVISPPEELTKRNLTHYIFSNNFITVAMNGSREEKLVTVWADREQLNIYVTLCDVNDCVLTFSQNYEINDRKLWAEPEDFQAIYQSPSGFFAVLPHQYTDGNIYQHIAHIRVQDDGSGRVTTFHGGTYDVIKVIGYDFPKDTLIFESAGGGLAFKRVYRIRNASTRLAQVQCISCSLPNCDSALSSVGPKGTRAAIICNQAFQDGRMYVMNTRNTNEFTQLRGMEETVLPFDLPTITHEKLTLDSKIEAHIGIVRPPKFDPLENYPVFLHVYAGPNSYINSLDTPWDFLVHLCTTRQLIIIMVDGRGSKHRGWDVKGPLRDSFGTVEIEDQIDAVKKITDKYPYMDKKALTVFGWSYGGFVSTHIGVKDQGKLFRCAMAVAPVSDFLLYDSAYTERYMDIPSNNPNGYNTSKLTDKALRLKNVNYFLAHGTSDDNVHYHNSALLAQILQEHNIMFTQLVYTNQDHSMGGVRPHMFREIDKFIDTNCLTDMTLL